MSYFFTARRSDCCIVFSIVAMLLFSLCQHDNSWTAELTWCNFACPESSNSTQTTRDLDLCLFFSVYDSVHVPWQPLEPYQGHRSKVKVTCCLCAIAAFRTCCTGIAHGHYLALSNGWHSRWLLKHAMWNGKYATVVIGKSCSAFSLVCMIQYFPVFSIFSILAQPMGEVNFCWDLSLRLKFGLRQKWRPNLFVLANVVCLRRKTLVYSSRATFLT